MPELLALFPLGSVLFPGLPLPLHVFEQRYRTLVQELLDAPEDSAREFGVVAIRAGREVGEDGVRARDALFSIGCVARLREVRALPDGRSEILAVGSTRFRLQGIDAAGTPYLTGVIERLGEPDGAGAEVFARSVARHFDGYRERLGAGHEPTRSDSPRLLSYLVASTMLLDVTERQSLLEEPDTAGRLDAELALLRRENGLVDALSAVPATDLTRTPFSPN